MLFLSTFVFLKIYRPPGENMDYRLLKIIACPICTNRLHFNKKNQELICRMDGLAYPLQNGIPVLLEDAARVLGMDEKHI